MGKDRYTHLPETELSSVFHASFSLKQVKPKKGSLKSLVYSSLFFRLVWFLFLGLVTEEGCRPHGVLFQPSFSHTPYPELGTNSISP